MDSATDISVTALSTTSGINTILELIPGIVHDIQLNAGWNMISSYVEPQDTSLEVALSGIMDDMVLMKNGNEEVYWPALSVNQIGDMLPGQ